MNLGLNLLMGMMRGGGSATTSNFTYSEIGGGVTGIVNKTSDATKAFMMAGGRGVWTGKITGTEAILSTSSSSGNPLGFVLVSIDGGAYVNASKPTTDFVLFTGLADIEHDVVVKYQDAYGGKPYLAKTGNILTVTGSLPSVQVMNNWTSALDSIPETTYAGTRGASNNTNFTPPYSLIPDSTKSITLKTSASKMQIFNTGPGAVHVSIDGMQDTPYVTTTNPSVTFIDLDGGEHTYCIWGESGVNISSSAFSVGVNSTFIAVPAAKSLIQFGDSITRGVGATDGSFVDTFRVASYFGYNGMTVGVSGETTVELDIRLDSAIPLLAPTKNTGDVIVLATGRNDGNWTPTISAAYTSILTKLRAEYGTILCRGVLPDGSNDFSSQNSGIEAAVAAFSDPNVVYINVDSWAGIATKDGTHPTDAGYDTIEGYALTAYAPYL